MITKIAGFVLIGSVAALAALGVADLTGLDEKLGWNHRVTRHYERQVGRHGAKHVRKRVEHRVERRVEAEVRAAEIDGVSGTYVFDAGGEALGKFPWSARAELELQPGGRYELRVKTDIDEDMSEETSWGRYKVRGDRLVIYHGDDSEHEFRIRGDRLEFDADFHEKVALKVVGLHDAALVKQRE